MTWHERPKDDAWRRVTLEHVAGLGQRIWLRCDACGHEQKADPMAFAAFHGLDGDTPLLAIAEKAKCTACGEHRAHCWPEPYRAPSAGGETGAE